MSDRAEQEARKAWSLWLGTLDRYEVNGDGELFPKGARVWVDWTDNELRPGRVMVARVLDLDLDLLHFVTVHPCGGGWQMKRADGLTGNVGTADHLGACVQWEPKGRAL